VSNTKTTEIAKTEPKAGTSEIAVRAAAVLAKVTADDYFDQPESADGGKAEKRFPAVPYVGFRTPKTVANLEALTAAKVAVGDAYLFDQEVLALKPFGVHLLKAATFYVDEVDQQLYAARFDADPEGKFKEKLLAVLAVRIPVGDTVTFKAAGIQLGGAGIKCLAKLRDMIDPKTGSAATREKWASRSARHKEAADAEPQDQKGFPFARVYANIYQTTEEPSEGKFKYQLGHSHLGVSTAKDIRSFYGWFAEARTGELAIALAQFEGRVNYLRKVATGEIDPTQKG